jgi:hypothetical protein
MFLVWYGIVENILRQYLNLFKMKMLNGVASIKMLAVDFPQNLLGELTMDFMNLIQVITFEFHLLLLISHLLLFTFHILH